MDTSLTIKPRDPVARSKSARASIARSEVAPTETVTPVKAAGPNHTPPAAQDAVGRDIVDPQGREVIYQARDEREREREQEKKRRHPDDALMRQRAYGRAAYPQEQHEQSGEGDKHADFEI